MCHYREVMASCVGDQQIIGVVTGETRKSSIGVALRHSPSCQFGEMSRCMSIDFAEEILMLTSPVSKFIISHGELFEDSIDTAGTAFLVHQLEPIPEAWSGLERIVTVLRLDQDVGIKEVHHAAPSSSAIL